MWKNKEKADHQVIPDLECDPVPGLRFGWRKKYVSIWDKVEVLLGCQRRNVQKVVGVGTSGSGKILWLNPKMIQESPDIGRREVKPWERWVFQGWCFRAGASSLLPCAPSPVSPVWWVKFCRNSAVLFVQVLFFCVFVLPWGYPLNTWDKDPVAYEVRNTHCLALCRKSSPIPALRVWEPCGWNSEQDRTFMNERKWSSF